MHWGVVGTALRVWFALDDGRGDPKTGVATGNFTVTVVAPDDSASTSPSVTESSQAPGVYRFDVPGSFLTTHGAGNYVAHIDVSVLSPKFNATAGPALKVDQNAIDTIGTRIDEVHKLHGLDTANDLVVSATKRTVGAVIDQDITDVAGTVTVSRNP